MLKKIYFNDKLGAPWISIAILLSCSIVSLPTFINTDFYSIFSLTTRPVYWWQYFVGIFEHSIYPRWFFWAHFLGNMSVIILFGAFVERILGSGKMFIVSLVAGVIYCITFQLINSGKYCTGSGVSGIVWAFAPIALYMLIKVYQYDKKQYGILFFIMLFEFFFIWVFITAVSSWKETNIYHAIATIIGIVFLIIWRKQIKESLENIYQNNLLVQTKVRRKDKFLIYLSIILPLGMITIFGLYQTNKLDKLYTEPISISSSHSLEEIDNNGGKIDIYFEAPVSGIQYESTSTPGAGIIQLKISYSSNRRTLILSFDQRLLEKETGVILLKNISLENGKKVKSIKIEF